MSYLIVELLKATLIAAVFASLAAQLRLIATPMSRTLKISMAGFLGVMLVPLTYLYMSLAFPAATVFVLPLQSLSIWLYGPFLIAFMHALLHVPMNRARVMAYFGPTLAMVVLRSFDTANMHASGFELLGLVQAGGFAVAALIWSWRRAAQLKVLVTEFSSSTFKWVLFLCFGLLALLALDFYIHWRLWLGRAIEPTSFYLMTMPCALYAMSASVALVWRLGAVAPLGPEPTPEQTAEGREATSAVVENVLDSRKLELTEHAAADLQEQLLLLLRDQKVHTRNDLSLPDLARELRISTHLASELLNHHLGMSFYGFLSKHRAAEAAALLADPQQNLSVADIAYEAGFNNTNTFYREFKRHHGLTPAQFRKECRLERGPATANRPLLIPDPK
jgi:AraC-like DNA-binding protein